MANLTEVTKRAFVARVVAAALVTAAVVWLEDPASWSWVLLALLAGAAGLNLSGSDSLERIGTQIAPPGWRSHRAQRMIVAAFAVGLAVAGVVVGFVVWLLGDLMVPLGTIDRIVFGFVLILGLFLVEHERYKRRELAPKADPQTQPDLTQQSPIRGAFFFGTQLGSGIGAFQASTAAHVVAVVAVLVHPDFKAAVIISLVFGLSRLTPLLLPRLRDLSRAAAVSNAQFLAVPALTLLVLSSTVEPFPLATVDSEQIAATPQPQINWTKIDATDDLVPRSNYSLTVAGTQALIWGGITELGYSADGLVLDANGTLLHEIGNAPISGRRGHSAVWTGTEMIVWGGLSQSGLERHADGAAYEPTTDTWRVIAPSPFDKVSGHTAIWTGSEMIIWGGTLGSNLRSGLGGAYNPSTDTWRRIRTARISARSGHSATWTGAEMVIWGGVTDRWVNDGAAYNPKTDRWRRLAKGPLEAAQGSLVTWTGTEVLIAGGTSNAGLHSAAALWNPNTNRWKRLPEAPSGPVDQRNATWIGEVLVVVTDDSTIVFDTRTLLWSSTAPPETKANWGYTPQALDGALVLFGGYSGSDDTGPFSNELWIAEVTYLSAS